MCQNTTESFTENTTSKIWLSGPICAPYRLIAALVLTIREQILMMVSLPMRYDDWLIVAKFSIGSILCYITSCIANSWCAVPEGQDQFWMTALALNLLGYATIFLPGFYIIKYVRESNYLDLNIGSLLHPTVRLCVRGSEADNIDEEYLTKKSDEPQKSATAHAVSIIFLGAGLLTSYGAWGYLQEKIMTTSYVDSLGNKAMYKNSQFLVFVNRILAFIIAITVMLFMRQPKHKAPLYKYSFCSFSNIMSSWCQYEALKFVSFPTQVLAKASKIIPVMAMGKLVESKKYEYYEYVVAVLISVGMTTFLMGNSQNNDPDKTTTFSGFIILLGYLVCDSFTSNWQGALKNEYNMTPIQMMAGVNLFSCLLTSVSLMQQGVFITSLEFISQYPQFLMDCVTLSICSAVGQLFIFKIITTYGPVVFTIMMTMRQVVSVIISCIKFNHPMSPVAIIGIIIIFSAVSLKVYCDMRKKKQKQKSTVGTKA